MFGLVFQFSVSPVFQFSVSPVFQFSVSPVFQFSVSPVCEGCKASPATAALFITSRVAVLERIRPKF